MGVVVSDPMHRLKHAVRPLIPDAVMARYRRRQHSRGIRNNVDLYVADRRHARRLRAYTPDTYRVVSDPPAAGAGAPDLDDLVWFGPDDHSLTPYLGHHESEAVAHARTGRPAMQAMRIVEPSLAIDTVVTTRSVAEAAGATEGTDAPTAYRLLTTAGARMGVAVDIDRDFRPDRLRLDGDVVVVLAAVPVHDIGGGSRAAQIAFELLRRGYTVVYVDAYPSSEAIDLGLRYPHPNLWQIRLPDFDAGAVAEAAAPGLVIVEAPIGDFIDPVVTLGAHGWTVVYDVIDDWSDEALGGMWYAPVFERAIVESSDAFTASAPDLVDRIAQFGYDAVLVPNAVNDDVFGGPPGERPWDLPEGPVLGYHGSLYGNWFDWEALAAVATAYPEHTIAVIGDASTAPTDQPSNVRFLGLKAQRDLPAYLSRFEVGLVPFTITAVTHAVSPLKVYEYLASGVPVAAPPLRALEGVEGVYADRDLVAAVEAARAAPRPDADAALARHSWAARLTDMFDAVGEPLRPADGPPVRVVTPPPPRRYARADRWIR